MSSYALQGPYPPELERELKGFSDWTINPIQLNRTGSLARGVAVDTHQRHIDHTLGFLGFCQLHLNLAPNQLSLSLFEDPSLILGFFLLLKVRR